MANRRALTDGINEANAEEVRAFVKQQPKQSGKPEVDGTELPPPPAGSISTTRRKRRSRTGPDPIGLIPVTVRMRPELAGALKRASLELQLAGEEVFSQQDLVELALEPWLREQGFLV